VVEGPLETIVELPLVLVALVVEVLVLLFVVGLGVLVR
jgi:hypothetical protein